MTAAASSGSLPDRAAAPLVVATVGTDHHPFDRLVRWVDEWYSSRRSNEIRCLLQRGTSQPPLHVPSTDYLPYHELEAALRDARAVVCHGGPATIMACIATGTRPIVVPRRRDLGEHVDDHQVSFARRIVDEGTIALAETQESFEALLDRELDEPHRVGSSAPRDSVAETVGRFEAVVTELLRGGRR